MKRFIAILLALILIIPTGITAMAAGETTKETVTSVKYDGLDFVTAPLGTAATDVDIDGNIIATVGGSTVTLSNVTWTSEDYSANTAGIYTFTPVLPDTYVFADGVELPGVKVLVADKGGAKISSVSYKNGNSTVIPDGIDVAALDMPRTVTAKFTLNSTTYTYDIPATFSSDDYTSTAGTYTFDLSVGDIFSLSNTLPGLEVTVSADAAVTKSGDVYEVTSADVRISGETRGNYAVTDTAGIYTYFDNVDIINALYAKGTGVEIIIESDVVYIENKIDLNGISDNAVLDIPNALVTKVRYKSDIASMVCINGGQMNYYTNVSATYTASSKEIYANGVPAIVAYGDDGGTYLYRANDMSLLYSGDITDWHVYGGGASGTTVESTNIAFMSGNVEVLFGGGKGTVYDATVVHDGGCASESIIGGGAKNSVTYHTTVVLESGQAKQNVIVGGLRGSTMGDSSKTYADDEYTNELHMYGGAYVYIFLGSSGTVYGNVKMIQHGGKVIYLYSSGSGTLNGNVDITVYGGFWEKQYEVQNTTGTSTLRLFRDILHDDIDAFPYIIGNNINVTYFDNPEHFEYIQYTKNREAVISSEGDAGNLVLRFFETRIPGEDKYTQKIYDGTGDSIYITFPNGQNMLMDTGTKAGGPLIVSALKELGVTKLDYVLLTHEHSDHIGAIKTISETFPIGTFILQPLETTASSITNAIAVNNSEVLYFDRYDSLMIGDVELYAINPSNPMQSEINTASMATVLTYGESKVLLGADTYIASEQGWMADPILYDKIKDCTVLKLGHHGIQSSNCYEYVDLVNADKIMITQMREYGVFAEEMIYQLMHVNGYNRYDISVTGMEGLTKVTLDGTQHGVTVVNEYERNTSHYADYTEIESIIEKYNSHDGVFIQEDIAMWEEALSLVEYDLPYEKQSVVDGMAEYLNDIFDEITNGRIISAVDTSGLVMETVFPYSGSITDTTNRWSENSYEEVAEPTFYATIPATVGGKSVDLPVTWISRNYDSKTPGVYEFEAVAPGYVFECDVPTIAVKVLDGAYANRKGLLGLVSGGGDAIDVVLKQSGISGTKYCTQIYDATGCNKIYNKSATPDSSKNGLSNAVRFVAGIQPSATGTKGKTVYKDATEGINKITVDGANIGLVAGGNRDLPHTGDTYVTIDNASVYVIAADGTTKDNYTIGGVYGGGYTTVNPADVTGDAHIDVSGLVNIQLVSGGGVVYDGTSTANLNGTAYVNIHGIEPGSRIASITRGTATNLVVYLDDSSASLVSVIENVDTDRYTKVYINGERYITVPADYSGVEAAIAKVPADLSIYTEESVESLNEVISAVDYNLPAIEQDIVDGYEQAILDAIDGLDEKPDADYSGVETAIASIPADLTCYTNASKGRINTAVNAVVYGLKSEYQTTVDGYASAITLAVAKATANHSYVDTVTPATPTSQGYTTHDCQNCTYSYVDSYTDYEENVTPEETEFAVLGATRCEAEIDNTAKTLSMVHDGSTTKSLLVQINLDKTTTMAISDVVGGTVTLDSRTVLRVVSNNSNVTFKLTITEGSGAVTVLDAKANYGYANIVLDDSIAEGILRADVTVEGTTIKAMTNQGKKTSSMYIKFNLPEGVSVAYAEGADTTYVSGDFGELKLTNPGKGRLTVPIVFTDAEGGKLEAVLEGNFMNAIDSVATTPLYDADGNPIIDSTTGLQKVSTTSVNQTGSEVTLTTSNATMFVRFDTLDNDGAYIEVESATRNLLGRYAQEGKTALRLWNPVYDEGKLTVNLKSADGEIIKTYNVTVVFRQAKAYTLVIGTTRATYTVEGETITVTANEGAANVFIRMGRYQSEKLITENATSNKVTQTEATGWRVYRTDEAVEFDIVFDASANGGEVITRHVIVNF